MKHLCCTLSGIVAILWVTLGGAQTPPSPAERLGYSPEDKLLIIHADDLGVAHSVNRASTLALQKGYVSSASIMVPCPWFPEIAAWARENPEADLGLHLTLTSEWKYYKWGPVLPYTEVPSLVDSLGFFHAASPTVGQLADPAEAEREIEAQIQRALEFGIRPTHLDSHMGSLFQNPALVGVYLKMGRKYRIPLLLPREQILETAPAMMAFLTPEDIVIDRLVMAYPDLVQGGMAPFYEQVLRNLKPGVTELIVHLAYDDPEMQAVAVEHPDFGSAWRQADLDFFSSEKCRRILEEEGIRLLTWRELGTLLQKN